MIQDRDRLTTRLYYETYVTAKRRKVTKDADKRLACVGIVVGHAYYCINIT